MQRQLIFFLAGLTPLLAAESSIELLEPEINGDDVTIYFTTRNYEPELGDRLLFQLAEDQLFSDEIVYQEVTSGPRLYRNLPDGDYYVRAFIKNAAGEMKSEWSNVVWFRIFTPPSPRPTLLLSGDEPVTGKEVTVVWTPLQGRSVISWELQLSVNPDFPDNITDDYFPASNEFRAVVSIDHLIGQGTVFIRVRARYPLEASEWSNLLIVTYDRPEIHLYSLPHVPDAARWLTWLQISMPIEFAGRFPDPRIEVSYLRSSVVGNPDLTRLVIDELDPGQTIRLPLSGDIDKAPVLIRSTVPLSLGLHYDNILGGDVGVVQINRHDPFRPKTLTGLVERRNGSERFKTFSALVIANQSDHGARVNVRMQVMDTRTNRLVIEREVLVVVDRWSNEAMLLTDLLSELADLDADGEVFTYTINVFVSGDQDGLDLLGATFNMIDGLLFPSYFQGVPY